MGKRAQRIPSWPGVINSNKGRIHLRRPTCHPHFSLATKRRTIHSGLPTIHELTWFVITRALSGNDLECSRNCLWSASDSPGNPRTLETVRAAQNKNASAGQTNRPRADSSSNLCGQGDFGNGDHDASCPAPSQILVRRRCRKTSPNKLFPGSRTLCRCRQGRHRSWPSCMAKQRSLLICAPNREGSSPPQLSCLRLNRHVPAPPRSE